MFLVVISLRYDGEENKKIEDILVKEVRGNFGKKNGPKPR